MSEQGTCPKGCIGCITPEHWSQPPPYEFTRSAKRIIGLGKLVEIVEENIALTSQLQAARAEISLLREELCKLKGG